MCLSIFCCDTHIYISERYTLTLECLPSDSWLQINITSAHLATVASVFLSIFSTILTSVTFLWTSAKTDAHAVALPSNCCCCSYLLECRKKRPDKMLSTCYRPFCWTWRFSSSHRWHFSSRSRSSSPNHTHRPVSPSVLLTVRRLLPRPFEWNRFGVIREDTSNQSVVWSVTGCCSHKAELPINQSIVDWIWFTSLFSYVENTFINWKESVLFCR